MFTHAIPGMEHMRAITYVIAVSAFVVGGGITFAVVRWLGKGSPELAFMVGAILGTQLAAIIHHRGRGASNSLQVKAKIGLVLALTAFFLGIVLHTVFGAFEYPDVSVPIGVVGAFVFPFVLFDTMWNAMTKATKA